ncbi:BatA and WFA domain-containing protein [Rummeliibacillus pycnus]|uniref:BatA and WFA domain-containing protein n=1 Tax=Rummeliibacillus pycnus TaxID=101070 RepID=UPI0037CA0711
MGISNLSYIWTAIIPLLVLIYYFFRKKYVIQDVSSTLFWREVMKETKVSPYLQHLQRNALFYLQMLTLLLMVFALLQPYIKSKTIAGEQIIWVVDTSATMLAKEGNQTVFEKHRQEMLALSNQLDGKSVTIITIGAEPKIILRDEHNTAAIQKAIKELQVTYSHEDWPNTMDFLQSIIGKKSTAVYVFTDSMDRKQLPKRTENVKWIIQGADRKFQNISLQRFGVIQTGNSMQAIAQFDNQTKKDQQATLKIYDANNKEISQKLVHLNSNQITKIKLDNLKLTAAVTAKLFVNDDYAADQSMSTVLATDNTQIYVDQTLHQLVVKAFQSIDSSTSTVSTKQLKTIQGHNLLVTNQTNLLTQSQNPILLIGRDDKKAFQVEGSVKVIDKTLFSYAPIDDIYVEKLYPEVKNAKTLATVGDKPFIQQTKNGHIVVLTDMQMTDWALYPSFPLFLWSANEKLTAVESQLGTFKPGEKRTVTLPESNKGYDIYSANDEYINSLTDGGSFVAPAKPGVYYVKSDGEPLYFVVALEQQEKTLSEGSSYQFGELTAKATTNKVDSTIMAILIVIMIVLLVAEWEVQRRHGFTY